MNSVICIEKEIAADTLGGLFESTGTHFLPYVEDCTVELVGQLTHYYDGIRKSALDSLLEIVRTMYELSNPAEWQPGLENVRANSLQPLKPLHKLSLLRPLRWTRPSRHLSVTFCHRYSNYLRRRITS